jgi:hypothetical protein
MNLTYNARPFHPERIMKPLWMTVLLLPSISFAAEAVKAPHFELNADFVRAATHQGPVTGFAATLPISSVFGAYLGTAYAQRHARTVDKQDSSDYQFAGGLFARHAAIGSVKLAYLHEKYRFDVPEQYKNQAPSDYIYNQISLKSELYFQYLTIALERSHINASGDNHYNTAMAGLRGYPTRNLSLELSADSMDTRDTYRATLEFQPEFLGYSNSFFAAFAHSPDGDGWSLGFSHFFGQKADLIQRDRQYR